MSFQVNRQTTLSKIELMKNFQQKKKQIKLVSNSSNLFINNIVFTAIFILDMLILITYDIRLLATRLTYRINKW